MQFLKVLIFYLILFNGNEKILILNQHSNADGFWKSQSQLFPRVWTNPAYILSFKGFGTK